MPLELYKQRRGRVFAGVCAGVASRFGWEASLVRGVFVLLAFVSGQPLLGLGLYIAASFLLPYKEDVYAQRYGMGERKVKEAEKIRKASWF